MGSRVGLVGDGVRMLRLGLCRFKRVNWGEPYVLMRITLVFCTCFQFSSTIETINSAKTVTALPFISSLNSASNDFLRHLTCILWCNMFQIAHGSCMQVVWDT